MAAPLSVISKRLPFKPKEGDTDASSLRLNWWAWAAGGVRNGVPPCHRVTEVAAARLASNPHRPFPTPQTPSTPPFRARHDPYGSLPPAAAGPRSSAAAAAAAAMRFAHAAGRG